jgi:hypothetical protein
MEYGDSMSGPQGVQAYRPATLTDLAGWRG